jgi:hypothetical protein
MTETPEENQPKKKDGRKAYHLGRRERLMHPEYCFWVWYQTPRRSMVAAHKEMRRLSSTGEAKKEAPSIECLRMWKTKYCWAEQAEAQDRKAAKQLNGDIVFSDEQTIDYYDSMDRCDDAVARVHKVHHTLAKGEKSEKVIETIAETLLMATRRIIKRINLEVDRVKVEDPRQLLQLAETSKVCLTLHGVLSNMQIGRVEEMTKAAATGRLADMEAAAAAAGATGQSLVTDIQRHLDMTFGGVTTVTERVREREIKVEGHQQNGAYLEH